MNNSFFSRCKICRYRYLMTAIVGIIGISLSFLMAIAINHAETARVKEYFTHRSEEYVDLIYHRLMTNLAVLNTLATFYTASEKVERDEFEVFTSPILLDYPSIKALNWVAYIPSAKRAVYETEARMDHPNFQITELNSQEQFVIAPLRPEYFSIYYSNSHQENEKEILGFDLASNPKWLQAIIQARDSGRITMTPPLKSLHFETEQLESLVFVPVYDTKSQTLTTVTQRREHLEGFVLGVFLIADIIETVLSSTNFNEIHLQVEDKLASNKLLYSSTIEISSPYPLSIFFEPFQVVHQREIASRHWSFTFTLLPQQHFLERSKMLSVVSLISGLILTGLMVTYLLILIQRNTLLRKEIHQREVVETQLQEAKQYAELITQTKSDFLMTLSQEMRVPLNNILDTTQALLSSSLTPQQQPQIKLLNTSSQLLLKFINDISDIAKIESGNLQLEQKPFHLLEAIQKVIALARPLAEEKKLTLNLRYLHSLPTYVNGDCYRLQQILTHLLNNAIKFTLQGGSIIIEVNAEFQDTTKVMLHTAIIDSGVGIDPEHHEQIFGKFEQLESSILQHFNDVGGLGLVICRRLIERMGGKIGVISKKGQGATFWFSLPLDIAEEPALIPAPSHEELPSIDLHRLRILLVEDNATNRMVTCLMLRKIGCQNIEIAKNGEEAVAMTATNLYDLVLMDIHMPVMDGLKATQLIRQREHTEEHREHLLVVALTADTTSESREACFFAGTDDYLTKPFCQKELLATLHRWLL